MGNNNSCDGECSGNDIGYYSYENVNRRMWHLSCYKRSPSENGVIRISYCCRRCDARFHHYFDASDGAKISSERADEMENKNKAAEELYKEAEEFLRNGNYEKAIEKFNSAYVKCTSGYCNEKEFIRKKNNAQTELDERNRKNTEAERLNKEGDELLRQGNYEKAIEKFNDACKKCTEGYCNRGVFQTKRDEAKNKWADQFNSEGLKLFNNRRFNDAIEKFRRAAAICTSGYHLNSTFEGNVQTAQNEIKFLKLDNLWDKALDAEKNENEEDARRGFQKAKDKAAEYMRMFPNFTKFKQFHEKINLKIEGNKDFNDGLKFQDDGISFLNEAKLHGEQGKFRLARECIGKAKTKLKSASNKFEEGLKIDNRFLSSVELTRELLKEINDLEKEVDNESLNHRLKNLTKKANTTHHGHTSHAGVRETINHVF